MYHQMTGASVAMLRYHDFVPKPYLEFGAMLLRNGVDRRDVAASNLAALQAALDKRFGLFRTVVHTAHGMPPKVGFREFLLDLAVRDTHGEDVRALWAPGQIPSRD